MEALPDNFHELSLDEQQELLWANISRKAEDARRIHAEFVVPHRHRPKKEGNTMIELGTWKLKIPDDIEVGAGDELFVHSPFGERFIREATLEEKTKLITTYHRRNSTPPEPALAADEHVQATQIQPVGSQPAGSQALLSMQERQEFEHHEQTIRKGLNTFFDVGIALGQIRDKRLYRENYDTFEEYCQERWEMSKTHANRFIASANVVKALKETPVIPEESSQPEEPSQSKMTPIGVNPERDTQPMPPILPENEAQVRPLTKLKPEKQQEAWKQVTEAVRKGAKLTAALVEESVKELLKQKEKPNVSCEQCGAVLPNKPLVELIDAESGKFLCEECKAKRPKPQGKTFEVEVQHWGNMAEVEEEAKPTAIAATIEELEKILAEEWLFVEKDRERAIETLQAIKGKTLSGKHVLSNIYNQLKDDGRILPGQKKDIRFACWNLLERLQAEQSIEEQPTRDFGTCAICHNPLTGPGNFGRHPNGAICDACLANQRSQPEPEFDFSFNTSDRNKIMQAGLKLIRPSWHEKELKIYSPQKTAVVAELLKSGNGTWKHFESFDTKKAMKERCKELEPDPQVIFESHEYQVEPPIISAKWGDLSDEQLKETIKAAKRELTQRHRPQQEGDPGAQYQDSSIPEYLLQVETPISPEMEIAADMPAASPQPEASPESASLPEAIIQEETIQEEWEQIHFPCRYCSTEVQQNVVNGRISCPGCQREWENFDTCYEANPVAEAPAAEQPGSSLDDILLSKLPGDGDLAITALQKALEDNEILENLANQIPNFHLPEIKEGVEKLLGKLKAVRNVVEKEVGHFKQQFQLEPPTIKELCSNCDFHKMKNSSTPGKLLAPHYHGKCTREGGRCEEVEALMEAAKRETSEKKPDHCVICGTRESTQWFSFGIEFVCEQCFDSKKHGMKAKAEAQVRAQAQTEKEGVEV